MFRLADQGRVWWPVTLSQANGPGDVDDVEVWLQYRIYNRAELRAQERRAVDRMAARQARAAAGAAEDAAHPAGDDAAQGDPTDVLALFESVTEREAGDVAELADRITDWRGFGDGDEEQPFTPERLLALLEFAPVFRAFRVGLFAASREAPRKNSQPGPGGSPVRVRA